MKIKQAETADDLKGILHLQQANLKEHLSGDEWTKEGFVTVKHTLEKLQKMNDYEKQVIATDQNKVIGYALVMVKEMKDHIPEFQPMFSMFSTINYRKKKLIDFNYYVMGQVCIDICYRGQGIFPALYEKHRLEYSQKYDFCVTEVSSSNHRSMRAHEKVGFKTVHQFRDAIDEWNIMVWDSH